MPVSAAKGQPEGTGEGLTSRLDHLEAAARTLREAVSGRTTPAAPPWTTLASVHSALAVLAATAAGPGRSASSDLPDEFAPGIRLLAEELVNACVRLRGGLAEASQPAIILIVRGLAELVRRGRHAAGSGSGGTSGGRPDTLLNTLLLVDELRAWRGGQLLSAAPVFAPVDLAALAPTPAGAPAEATSATRRQQLRQHFQQSLTAWNGQSANAAALGGASKSAEYLARYASSLVERGKWRCVAGYFQALSAGGLRPGNVTGRLASQLARAIWRPEEAAPGTSSTGDVEAHSVSAVAEPVLAMDLVHATLAQLAANDATPPPILEPVWHLLTPAARFGAPNLSEPVPPDEGLEELRSQLAELCDEVSAVTAGGMSAVPAAFPARLARACDGLALAGRYAERMAITRQWPGLEQCKGETGALGPEPPFPEEEIDWHWLGMTLRSLREEDCLERPEQRGVRADEEPGSLPESDLSTDGAEPGDRAGLDAAEHDEPVSPDGDDSRPDSRAALRSPADALRRIEAALGRAKSAASAGQPFAEPLPASPVPARRSSALPEPVDERVGEPPSGMEDSSNPAGAVDLAALAERFASGLLGGEDVPDAGIPEGRPQSARTPAPPDVADLLAGQATVDRSLLENLTWIAQDIGTSRGHAEQQIGALRQSAIDFDRTLRGMRDELRRLRGAGHPGATSGNEGESIESPEPAGFEESDEHWQRLEHGVAALVRIQDAVQAIAGQTQAQLRRQAAATGSLQAGLSQGAGISVGALWDEIVPAMRERAHDAGLDMVFALTGGGTAVPAEAIERAHRLLTGLLEDFVAQLEAADGACTNEPEPETGLAGSAGSAAPAVIDVSVKNSGVCLLLTAVLRAPGVDASGTFDWAALEARLEALSIRGWRSWRTRHDDGHGAIRLAIAGATGLLRVLPVAVGPMPLAVQLDEVVAVVPGLGQEVLGAAVSCGRLTHEDVEYELVHLPAEPRTGEAGTASAAVAAQDPAAVAVLIRGQGGPSALLANRVDEAVLASVSPLPAPLDGLPMCWSAAVLDDGMVLPIIAAITAPME